ncbi:MAG: protein jag [Dehalococcoidia bacterium]|nr:protein jag [Dehalococcoidia bacterium]
MESIEISAKSEEEAVDIALAELGLSRSEVDVVIVKKGRTGLFGFGAEEVRVRVTPREMSAVSTSGVQDVAQEVLRTLLNGTGIDADIHVEVKHGGEQSTISLDIEGDDLGILIGRRGETLTALQYLVNLIVSRQARSYVGVVVDVEGYRKRRYEALRQLARRLADQVRSTGRPVTLEPMSAGERRIIHLELRDNPYVSTQSVGQGDGRKIAIFSKGDRSRTA